MRYFHLWDSSSLTISRRYRVYFMCFVKLDFETTVIHSLIKPVVQFYCVSLKCLSWIIRIWMKLSHSCVTLSLSQHANRAQEGETPRWAIAILVNGIRHEARTWRDSESLDCKIRKYSAAPGPASIDATRISHFLLVQSKLPWLGALSSREWKEDHSRSDLSNAALCAPSPLSLLPAHNSVMFSISRGLTVSLVTSATWQRRRFADLPVSIPTATGCKMYKHEWNICD